MGKAVMISIRPEWCEKILKGQKTIEVRKNAPKLETPFKCYIYCTAAKGKEVYHVPITKESLSFPGCQCTVGNKRVVAEFTCDKIIEAEWDYKPDWNGEVYGDTLYLLKGCCLSDEAIISYGNGNDRSGNVYGWHISELKIYGKPKELSDFKQCHRCEYYKFCNESELSCDRTYNLRRPPQSWCYVEELPE